MRLRRDDFVIVLSGDFRGQAPSKVVSISGERGVAYIEDVGVVLKHVKRGHHKSPQGGRVLVPSAIKLSKIALYCSKCGRGVRVKQLVVDGVKKRACGRCCQIL